MRWCTDHPRTHGEYAGVEPVDGTLNGSSPHTRGVPTNLCTLAASPTDHPRATRGVRPRGHHRGARPRIIPAHAGSTRRSAPSASGPTDHPRARGEYCVLDASKRDACRIIPAHAGSTARESSRYGRETGSSPHTRGVLFEITRVRSDSYLRSNGAHLGRPGCKPDQALRAASPRTLSGPGR